MTAPPRTILRDLVAPGTLLPEEASGDWALDGRIPAAVLAPSSEEEVGRILERASGEGWKVIPAGYGRWLAGGGPVDADVVISTRRIRDVTEYEPADLTFTAGAGISLSSLARATGAHGQWLPLDPPGGEEGSLGAAVATGMGGGLRQWYGTPRDHVLGLTLVSGDGRVLRWGGRVVKNVAGFDVTKLCIGSWGALGVITSVSARLFPLPEVDTTLVLEGADVSSLLPQAQAMAATSLPLAAIELLGPAGREPGDSGRPAALAVRLLGSREEVEAVEARVRSELEWDGVLAGRGGAAGSLHSTRSSVSVRSSGLRSGASRRSGFSPGSPHNSGEGDLRRLEGEESRAFHRRLGLWEEGVELVLRLVALPSLLGDVLRLAKESEVALGGPPSGEGARVRIAAHVGAGIVRVGVSGIPAAGVGLEGRMEEVVRLRGVMEGMGGSLTVSGGPAALVREVGTWGARGGEETLLRALKGQFDPQGILVPGRVVG